MPNQLHSFFGRGALKFRKDCTIETEYSVSRKIILPEMDKTDMTIVNNTNGRIITDSMEIISSLFTEQKQFIKQDMRGTVTEIYLAYGDNQIKSLLIHMGVVRSFGC